MGRTINLFSEHSPSIALSELQPSPNGKADGPDSQSLFQPFLGAAVRQQWHRCNSAWDRSQKEIESWVSSLIFVSDSCVVLLCANKFKLSSEALAPARDVPAVVFGGCHVNRSEP